MSTYWDQLTVNITNDVGLPLTVANVPNLSHGEYGTYPQSVPGQKSAEPSFVVRSLNASEIGPVGGLSYNLSDGTALNVNFDMEFAAGQSSSLTAAIAGARASAYSVAVKSNWESWHGQGTRWTVDIALSPIAGDTSASCSFTR
jgi:hypothetical protein